MRTEQISGLSAGLVALPAPAALLRRHRLWREVARQRRAFASLAPEMPRDIGLAAAAREGAPSGTPRQGGAERMTAPPIRVHLDGSPAARGRKFVRPTRNLNHFFVVPGAGLRPVGASKDEGRAMNGQCEFWRRALRARRLGDWHVRLTLAEARLRRELAAVYA